MSLEFLELGDDNYNKIVVFIHGWKGNKHSFESIASIMKIPQTKWFLPQAPYKIEGNNNQYSWAFENSDGTFDVDETIISFTNSIKTLLKFLTIDIIF